MVQFQVLCLLNLTLGLKYQVIIVYYSYVQHSVKNQYQLYIDLNNDKALCKGILTEHLLAKQEKCLITA